MREFLYPETRRFIDALLRVVLLVAMISIAPSLIDWCDQAARALAELPAAEQVNLGDQSYSIKPGQAPAITQLEQVLQAKIEGSNSAESAAATSLGCRNGFIRNIPRTTMNDQGRRHRKRELQRAGEFVQTAR